MSNYFRIIFLSFTILLTGYLPVQGLTVQDSLIQLADQLFVYEMYEEAIEVYESLYAEGYVQEEMLYRLSFMHEQSDHFPEAIYYLRCLQWEFGGKNINDKIAQLMDRYSKGRLSPGEGWSSARLFVKRFEKPLLVGGILTILLAAICLFLPWKSWRIGLGSALAGLGLMMCFMLGSGYVLPDRKGVVMLPTYYYDEPTYAAQRRSLPIGPGATVNIEEEQDIWLRVSLEGFESWVPRFVVRELKTTNQ
ncbi:MAG: hypothetical protein AAFR61_08985 [Bacteroidota bacterium]